MAFRSLMAQRGEQFEIIRDGNKINEVDGVRNSSRGRKMVQFYFETDVQPGDWISSLLSQEKFFIEDVMTSKGFDLDSVSKNAFYLTEVEHRKQTTPIHSSNVTFNIQDVQNSIIGSQQNATLTNNFSDKQITDYIDKNCGPDKELMTEMLNMVNAVIENNVPVQKGTFARFSETASKYGWLLGAVTTKLLAHFFK